MNYLKFFIISVFIIGNECLSEDNKWPSVALTVLVRNKAHALPYFLSCLAGLDYPKDRIYLWIYSDYNEDNSIEIINKWADKHVNQYHSVNITVKSTTGSNSKEETVSYEWTPDHFKHIIKLREEALNIGRKLWADYLFMLDADVFLTDPLVLKHLVSKEYTIVAPMLLSDGLYSNFWCGMTESYYYKRTDDYKPILYREKTGCFDVVMIHTAVLISLRAKKSDFLTYDPQKLPEYDGPEDDIITFALSSTKNDIPLKICNDHLYGFVPLPLTDGEDLNKDYNQVLNIKLEAISKRVVLPLDPYLENYVTYPEKTKLGCNEIYMINLERRREKRKYMDLSFKELGLDVNTIKAFDGRTLDINDLSEFGITLMPNYEDPYYLRPMKTGEIGCFLSHYYLWKEIVDKNLQVTLILEDDIHFAPHFRQKFVYLLSEIKDIDWDLVYIGRKILQDKKEEFVTPHTSRPLYSYWTLGYLLSQRGAQKLIDAQPLTNLLPVDEFLPIMFDQHPNETWKSYFPNRNLLALSAAPLLIHPTHYTGDEGYVSDTEDSTVLTDLTYQRNEL